MTVRVTHETGELFGYLLRVISQKITRFKVKLFQAARHIAPPVDSQFVVKSKIDNDAGIAPEFTRKLVA